MLLLAIVAVAGALSFDKAHQHDILEMHNVIRSQIANGNFSAAGGIKMDPAGNMRRLFWNASLAELAAKDADACVFEHTAKGLYGQNIYSNKRDTAEMHLEHNAKDAVVQWANEFKTFGALEYVYHTETGHATQVAWAETSSVGCGYAFCEHNHRILIFCNYFPAGNYIGLKAYKKGSACSSCPEKTICDEKIGLCTGPPPKEAAASRFVGITALVIAAIILWD